MALIALLFAVVNVKDYFFGSVEIQVGYAGRATCGLTE